LQSGFGLLRGEEAAWWASREGRKFLRQKSTEPRKKAAKGRAFSTSGPGNRSLATRKGIGYQSLLQMPAHESLRRGAR
jgi:hypothetical protein